MKEEGAPLTSPQAHAPRAPAGGQGKETKEERGVALPHRELLGSEKGLGWPLSGQERCQEQHPPASHPLLGFREKQSQPPALECLSAPIPVSHLQMSQVARLGCRVTVHLSPLAMLGAMTGCE